MNKPEYLTGECKTLPEWIEANPFPKDISTGIVTTAKRDKVILWACQVRDIHSFQYQPFTKDMIVRPEEPNEEDRNGPNYVEQNYIIAFNKWNNWQPLFKGEWEVIPSNPGGIILYNGKTFEPGTSILANLKVLDDFIPEAKKAGIKLKWTTT